MVASLDGFIAKENGGVDWLTSTDEYAKGKVLTEEEIATFLKGIDCYLMGSKTYEHALELGWPYGETPVFVLSKRQLPNPYSTVQFLSGDLPLLIDNLRQQYSKIWMAGGAILTRELLQQHLVDELVVSIVPILLGQGTLFFDQIHVEQHLHLENVTTYRNGMVELQYQIVG